MTADVIGSCAAVLTTIAFVPQVVRTWRMGGRELSWGMLSLFGTGVTLWLVYGWMVASAPLMGANAATLIQVLLMVVAKLRGSAQRATRPIT